MDDVCSDVKDPIYRIAVQVADCLSEGGYAFVEDAEVETLAMVIRSSLTATGILIDLKPETGIAES